MLVTADARNPIETETDLLVVPLLQVTGERQRLPTRAAALPWVVSIGFAMGRWISCSALK